MQRLPSHSGAFKTAPHPSPFVLIMLLLCQAGAGVQALSTKQHNMQAGWLLPSAHPGTPSPPPLHPQQCPGGCKCFPLPGENVGAMLLPWRLQGRGRSSAELRPHRARRMQLGYVAPTAQLQRGCAHLRLCLQGPEPGIFS